MLGFKTLTRYLLNKLTSTNKNYRSLPKNGTINEKRSLGDRDYALKAKEKN